MRKKVQNWRSFPEARAYVHQLGLKNYNGWKEYCISGEKPDDVPSTPNLVYASEFKGYSDWLGTTNKKHGGRKIRGWRSFLEARAYVHQLKLKNYIKWVAYCGSGEKPEDIPSNPKGVYPEFKGYNDWLSTEYAPNWDRNFLPFPEARTYVHTLELRSVAQWRKYCKSGEKPDNIPVAPDHVYQDEFEGYGDWLGTRTIAPQKRQYLPFLEARALVRKLKLKDGDEWMHYCQSGEKPANIPAAPWRTYAEFQSLSDWLGSRNIHPRDREFLPFEEARAFARNLGLKTDEEWRVYCRSEKRPQNIPSNPGKAYPSEYKGIGDWLGIINAWNRNALLALLRDLRPQIASLQEDELHVILQQGGAFPAMRAVLGKASPMQVLKDLRENNGEEIERALTRSLEEEIMAPTGDLSEEVITGQDLPNAFGNDERENVPEPSARQHAAITEGNNGLPQPLAVESLHVIDLLSSLPYGLDDEAAEYLVANRVSALWESYITAGRAAVHDLLLEIGVEGYWFSQIKRRFLFELDEVERLDTSEGWSFTDTKGHKAFPNSMQRRTAWMLREKHRVGNWSGVGAGKTLSAVLASRVIDARLTLIVTNNATVQGWQKEIKKAYCERSNVLTNIEEDTVLEQSCYNYIVLNYEKFQGPRRNHLVHFLLSLHIDFIVFDEVQFVKQRDSSVSKRREALAALVSSAAEMNPHLRVLGMSATPVINNLLEAKKLLEIVTGKQFSELQIAPTVNNALTMHRALMLYGFRYRPHYEQEMPPEIVTISGNDLLPALRNAQGSVLQIEQLLIPAKLECVSSYLRKGTILYTHYVQDIVGPIRRYAEGLGLSVGLYTDHDKSGLSAFLDEQVDILLGTRPIGTGLDGLQKVCNRMVLLSLPWTSAEYEQLVGRIRRQGSAFDKVEIIVAQVILDYEGRIWSWDQGRWAVIQTKYELSSCVLDGRIPKTVHMNQDVLLKQSREALERWIERIGKDDLCAFERQQFSVPLPPDVCSRVQARHGDFTVLNQRWNASRSRITHERIQHDPSEWYLYHTLYRKAREQWPEQPCDHIAEHIRVRPDWIVGDFGCGECLLRQALPQNRIIGIDHIAYDEQVIACDMISTPLKEASLDAAVFSLSLMGTNWMAYLEEAYRTLKPYGHLFIAEPHRRWPYDGDELKNAIVATHFRLLGNIEQRYDFIYLTAIKI